jgi:hypothetical protein
MTLEKFKIAMNVIKDFREEQNLWQSSLEKLFPESYLIVSFGDKLLDGYICLLEDKFPETSVDEWIFYYVYECEMGSKINQITINGKDFPLNSEEQLYKLLTNNIEE